MRDYGKVYSTFWSSATTAKMSEDGKLLALYLMTCSHSTIAGVFRLPDGYVSEDLGWTLERVQKGFAELFDKGFANRCETTKWVWVCKHLEWNKPENPNQRKAAAKIAISVPDECAWKPDFMRACAEVLAIEIPPAPNPPGTVGKGLLNQKQKQKQDLNQEQDDSADLLTESTPVLSEFSIPLNDGTEHAISKSDVEMWTETYRAVDVEQELREMRVWSLANPSNRKTSRGVAAFIVRWLGKAQDTPGRARPSAATGEATFV